MCNHNEIVSGIIVGAGGGASASFIVIVIVAIRKELLKCSDKKKVYDFIEKRLSDRNEKWSSTRTIASYTDLTIARVRYICSIHKKIKLSTGENDDMWGIKKDSNN